MKLQAFDNFELKIESVSSDGNGVGHIDGIAVFVPYTAVGDTAYVRVVEAKKNYVVAEIVKLDTSSPCRVAPACERYYECGGCVLMHMEYSAQLEAKKGIIENAMRRIGGFKDFCVSKMYGMDEPWRYRNKMVFHAGRVGGENVFGFYAPKSHKVIPLGDCLCGASENTHIIDAVKEYMNFTGLGVYDEKTLKGAIRMIFVRKSAKNGDTMVVLSVNGSQLPETEMLIEKLKKACPTLASVILNVNTQRRSYGLGTKNVTLYGADYIEDEISGIIFRISPHSFFQINPQMTEKLYSKAIEMTQLTGNESVMDIYCGIGTISLLAARSAKKVIGVEIVEKAIEDAKENAVRNGIDNAVFYADSAENIVPRLIGNGERPDVVILDPPRKGSDVSTLNAILAAKPERIVYVSCNPATLARDARVLCDGGYGISNACGFDQFCHTHHVETVVLLSQLKPDDVIEVDIDLDELDITSSESKATYEEIKAYVLDKYGFKVSSLYIAQIKTKYGIKDGINYNLSKKGSRVPACPPEKEQAITDALKYFKMIE